MAEPLPAEFVQRPAEFEQLVSLLLARNDSSPVAISTTAALRGAGGYGKTTLAKAVCYDPRVRQAFRDGILWVTLGESASQLTQLNELTRLIHKLSGLRESFTSLIDAANQFAELIADRDLLLVIDDVWNREHLRSFLQGGQRCARLITTRNLDTLPANAQPVNVAAMQPDEAVNLLQAGLLSSGLEECYDDLRRLAARLGEWPLLLGLVNGALRDRIGVGETAVEALAFIRDDLTENGLTMLDNADDENRNRAVCTTLSVSFKRLHKDELRRFYELAIFPEDVDVPLVTVERLWRQTAGLTKVAADKLYERLFKLSLLLNLDRSGKTLRLHDVIWKYLNDRQIGNPTAIHNHLLDAHRPVQARRHPRSSATSWSTLPDDEPYFWDRLVFHLIKAGRNKELIAAAKDWRYLAKKTLLRRSHAVENDLLKAEELAPTNKQLRSLRRNYSRLSHLLNHCKTQKDIEATFFARLQHLSELKTMLRGLAKVLTSPYVAPNSALPDLPHPVLIRTLEGHLGSVTSCAFSPDGRLIVSASEDCTLRLWDVYTGGILRTLQGHYGSVTGCIFSPDGKLIVSTSNDRTLKIWDVQTGKMLHSLEGHSDSINSCEICSDGRLIAPTPDHCVIEVWDAHTGMLLLSFEGIWHPVTSCTFSPDSRLIASALNNQMLLDEQNISDQTFKVWEARTGAVLLWLEGNLNSVSGCAFSPDSRLIVSTFWDQALKVWDAHTGKMLRSLGNDLELDPVSSCVISPDGELIASASRDSALKIWNVHTGEMLKKFIGHNSSVRSCAFSPDGKQIALTSDGGILNIWDMQTGKVLRTLGNPYSHMISCAFSPDGKLIVSASRENLVRKLLRVHEVETNSRLSSATGCAFSPDGKLIVSVSDDRSLKVWDIRTGEMLRMLQGHLSSVTGCAFSPDGKMVVSASNDKTLKVWDVQMIKIPLSAQNKSESISGCTFSPDGKLIVSVSDDRSLKIWDAHTGEMLRMLQGHLSSVTGCAFSPDGKMVVSASCYDTIKFWDTQTSEKLGSAAGYLQSVGTRMFSPDGKLIILASWDNRLKVRDIHTGKLLHSLKGDWYSLHGCAYNSKGELIILSSDDRVLKVWNVYTSEMLFSLAGVRGIAFGPNGSLGILASHLGGNNEPESWDTQTGKMLGKLPPPPSSINGCKYSPDGKLIVSASWDNSLKVWDTYTGEIKNTLRGHSSIINACAFSPDGKLLASASQDLTLKIWNVNTGEILCSLEDHSDSLTNCAFSPDGKLIVSASNDHTLKIWDTHTGNMMRSLEGHLDSVTGCAFSLDGELLVSASWDGMLKVWNVLTGECATTFYADGPMNSCAIYEEIIVAGGARGLYFLRLIR